MDKENIQSRKRCSYVGVRQVTGQGELIFTDVKTKNEIIETLAKERFVERMIENIAHQSLSADLKDLSQMVYLILLEYDESRLQDLWEHDQMNYFIARIIVNQYRSSNSPFHTIFRKFRQMIDESVDMSRYDEE